MIALLITFILIGATLLIAMNEYYFWIVCGRHQNQEIMKRKKHRSYDRVAFGSSYCRYGLDFDNRNSCNFGFSGQFFYYTDLMLREYTPKCLKKNGIVYLIIADLVFAEIGKGMYGPENYQLLLSRENLGDEYSFSKYVKMRFPFVLHPNLLILKIIARHIVTGVYDEFYETTVNPYNKSQTLEAAKQRCSEWCKQFKIENTISGNVSAELNKKFKHTRSILTGMIQFCIDNGFRPVLVVTPISSEMRSQLSDIFLKTVLYDNIRIANKQNVPFFDYLKDERFSDSSLYLKSADFLNAKGRKLFTKILLSDTKDVNR